MKLSDAKYASGVNAMGVAVEFAPLFALDEKERVDVIQDALIGLSVKQAESLLKRLIDALGCSIVVSDVSVPRST